MKYKNFSSRINTGLLPPMGDVTLIQDIISPIPGKSFFIEQLYISYIYQDTVLAQFLNPELLDGVFSLLSINADPASGCPAALAPNLFAGVPVNMGVAIETYLKGQNAFDYSGVEISNSARISTYFANMRFNQAVIWVTLYAKIRVNE